MSQDEAESGDNLPNTLVFKVPILCIICWVLGIDHPSSPPVAEFSRTKSRVKRYFCGAPLGVGFETRWTWLHSVACDSLIASSFKSVCVSLSLSLFLFRVLTKSYEVVADYMEVATCPRRPQSSLVRLRPVSDDPWSQRYWWIPELRLWASSEDVVTS